MMFKVKTFRKHWAKEDLLGQEIEDFLNENHLNREDIVDIKYYAAHDWLYCMIIWEDK